MSDAKWNSFPHLSAAQLADADQLPVSDASQPEGSKDATTTVAALREAVAPPAPDASEVGYDNASSGLEASDVQAAVDEVMAGFGQLVGGLGTAAFADAGDFATAAQGSAADTALQPGDALTALGSVGATAGHVPKADGSGGIDWLAESGSGASAWGSLTGTLSDQTDLQNALDAKADASSLADVATSGDYDDLSNKPTLGSAAAANTGDFATAAQGGKADTALQPGDELTDLASTGATAGHVPKADGSGGINWAAESGGGGGGGGLAVRHLSMPEYGMDFTGSAPIGSLESQSVWSITRVFFPPGGGVLVDYAASARWDELPEVDFE